MSRHRAAPARSGQSAAARELLGWAGFAAPACVLALGLLGAGWVLALGVGLLIAVVFAAVWFASVVSAAQPSPPDRDLPSSGSSSGSSSRPRTDAGDEGPAGPDGPAL